jgi:hypothetical protein
MKDHTITATSLIVAMPYRPGPSGRILPGTAFRRSDYEGDPAMLASIDRAVAKGGVLIDGIRTAAVPTVDPFLRISGPKGEAQIVDVTTGQTQEA